LIAKPVARRDKPRSQRVSHEDTLPKKLSAVSSQLPAKNHFGSSPGKLSADSCQLSAFPDTPSSLVKDHKRQQA
jgi:hypothetical protein